MGRNPLAGAIRALVAVERVLLPPECLLCADPVPAADGDALVCGPCRTRWRPVPHPVCARCGQPADRERPCTLCTAWPAALARVRSAVWLDGGARDLVHQLKYGGWPRAAEAMAAAMRGLEPLTPGVFLLPIPLAPKRLRERGYNQSERLAAALAARTGLAVRTDLLRRTRETRTQTALAPDARQANVAGAFTAARLPRIAAGAPARAVLVDDVFTTGATLVAAAAALVAAGAARVEAVTFARAAPAVG